jgi:hypothetical protein
VLVAVGLACTMAAGSAAAQGVGEQAGQTPRVEVAPFAGLQFGGSVRSFSGAKASVGTGLDYGGTVDVRFADSWRIELLYSRQETELGGDFEATIERFMAGVSEEHLHGSTRFFGEALLGATRFVPGFSGFGSDSLFTMSLGLGVKHLFTEHVGVRAEARGFYLVTEAGGGIFCSGGCLFTFSGSGLFQGDVSAGLLLAF